MEIPKPIPKREAAFPQVVATARAVNETTIKVMTPVVRPIGVIFEHATGIKKPADGLRLQALGDTLEKRALRSERRRLMKRLKRGNVKFAHRDAVLDTINTIDKNLSFLEDRKRSA